MLRLRSMVGLVTLLLVDACGSDTTGLRTSPTLTGNWQMAQFSIDGQYQGGTFSCSLTGMTITCYRRLQIAQNRREELHTWVSGVRV